MPLTLLELRRQLHLDIAKDLLFVREGGEVSIADGSQQVSVRIAASLVECMGIRPGPDPRTPQAAGSYFAALVARFVEQGLCVFGNMSPVRWEVETAPGRTRIARFSQYSHLGDLEELLKENPAIRATLGGDYIVTPDITIARPPLADEELNAKGAGLTEESTVARLTPQRRHAEGSNLPTLHASISMKLTMRSDRAQNTRTEALNLLRNRKGRAPHIAVVTLEPLPSRIASIAQGTGDVDCTYHVALHELMEATRRAESPQQFETLSMLVDGGRLRDISDLVLDLLA